MFVKEQVSEEEAREYAKEIGAVYRLTSAFSGTGIEELFKALGCKILDPNYIDEDDDDIGQKKFRTKSYGVKLEKQINKESNETKKKCCKWNFI